MVIYMPEPTTPHRRAGLSAQRSRTTPEVALVRDDLYAVLAIHETMGFVERVGNVFVALYGSELHHAVEVGQSLSYDQAVQMVHYSYLGN